MFRFAYLLEIFFGEPLCFKLKLVFTNKRFVSVHVLPVCSVFFLKLVAQLVNGSVRESPTKVVYFLSLSLWDDKALHELLEFAGGISIP